MGMRFLAIRLEWIGTLSLQPGAILTMLITAARWALSLGLYGGILLGLSFAVREKVFMPAAVFCMALLGLGFAYGVSCGLDSWEKVPPEKEPAQLLGGPGLILANSRLPSGGGRISDATLTGAYSAGSSGTSLVLLRGPSEPGRARVVAIPGKPIAYQAEFTGRDPASVSLPPVLFGDESPWFLKSLVIDLRLNAENLRMLFNEGFLPFVLYTGALVFLLCSLSFVLKFSAWPLVSLSLGCLAFRGILALETLFNSPEMQDIFNAFLQNRLPVQLAVPLIFCGVGFLAYLYSFLVYLAKRQGEHAA